MGYALRRIAKEWQEFRKNPTPMCSVGPHESDSTSWQAIIIGPQNTPYEVCVCIYLSTYW
eukprot:m.147165 g.147165  ORF g.147165 m.147165 type:complete len:60 (+) comp138940_c0_seq1:47-226(+)